MTVYAPWCSAVVLSRSPLTVSSQAACLLGSVSNWRFGGLLLRCWLRDRGVLLRTAVDYARVFPFFVTEDNCTLDANVLHVLLFKFYDDSSSSTRICPFLAECDRISRPRERATHLTSWHPGVATSRSACSGHSHDATWPLFRETSQPTASPFLSIRTGLRASHVGTELQPEKLEQGREPKEHE